MPTLAGFRTGIEIEFNTNADRSDVQRMLQRIGRSDWQVKSDGSIGNGWEIVSPVLLQHVAADQIREVCAGIATLGDALAGPRCGLHVHLSGFDNCEFHTVRNVVRRYCNFEDTLDLLQPLSRRGSANQYCKSNVQVFGRDPVSATQEIWSRIENVSNVHGLMRMFNPTGRYYKVNLESLSRHGTIEFRHHSGTIDATEIVGWVRFLWSFTEVAMQQQRLWKRPVGTPETTAERFRKMVRGVPPDVVQYLRRRIRTVA